MQKDATVTKFSRLWAAPVVTAACAGLTLAAIGPLSAAPAARAAVPDATDYMPDVSASHVMNVNENNCLPLERDPSSMPSLDMVYPDRRGFDTTGMSSIPDAWSRPISIGGLNTSSSTGGLTLQMHDALGNTSQIPLASLLTHTDDSNFGVNSDNGAIQNSLTLPRLSEPAPNAPSPVPNVQSRFDRWTSRFTRLTRTFSEVQQRLTFTTAEKDTSAPSHGLSLSCAVAQPGQSQWMDTGVLGLAGASRALGGMKLAAQYLPVASNGIGQRLAFSWGERNANAVGALRLTGGRVAGEMFRETTITQRLNVRGASRTVIGWTNFQLAGQRWNEAIVTSAYPMDAQGEFGVGFALQQTGMGPFISMARPFAHGGQFSIALGAPNSIASRAPISLQLACPL